MHPNISELLTHPVVITDGAWGTQLQLRGLPQGECPDAWNLTQPEKVREVALAYVNAGSKIILTNTFGGNICTLKKNGLESKAYEINRRGVEISRDAAGKDALVYASMGPSGIILMMGEVTEDELYTAFLNQAQALADGGADGLVIETMSDPDEAVLAIRAAKTTGLPVVGCMVFDSGKNLDRTMMGTSVEQAAEVMLKAGADVVGSNCGKGIESFIPICQRMSKAAGGKVWIKANRGLPQVMNGETTYAQTPEQFADYIPALLEAGAGFLGGCCGTTPDFIAAVSRKIQNLNS